MVAQTELRTLRMRVPSPEAFNDGHGNTSDYLPAPELERTAQRLAETKAGLGCLPALRVGYLWKRKGGMARGKARLGQCQKPSGLLAHYADLDFVIWLAADHGQELTAEQLEAALYHEMLHMGIDDEKEQPVIVPHDVEAFAAEVREYGLWRAELEHFAHQVRQLGLFTTLKQD